MITDTAPTPSTLPSRVVTIDNEGWYNTPDGYMAGYTQPAMSLDEIDRTRGPLRPVLPITDEDEALLRETFTRAGRKTVTTIAAAVEQVFHELREQRGGLATAHDSYEYAKRTLTAGRAGSWESAVLIEVMLFGNGLNLAPNRGRGHADSVQVRRERGPSKRVDVDARRTLVELLTRWVTGPDRYTEVAETLAAVVSRYADDTAGPDGWRAVADQWLQPGALARQDFVTCYRLLYSLSEHFNPHLL